MIKINTPLKNCDIAGLKAGDWVSLSGVVYTARDQAHKRLVEVIMAGEKLPIELDGQVIYYCGPTVIPPGKIMGSCGPTTSSRMDNFTVSLLERGLKGMIGKGDRSKEAIRAIKRYKAVYFLAYAGCGALLREYVKAKRLVAYPDLGPEAIYELEVKNFPLIAGIDSKGRDIFKRQ